MGWLDGLTRRFDGLPKDGHERAQAVRDLHGLGDSKAAPVLIRALRDPDFEVAKAAAEALGDIRSLDAIVPLAECLDEDVHPYVMMAAAHALAQYGMIATQALVARLTEPLAVEYVTAALGEIGDPRAIEPLLRLLADHNQYQDAQKALAMLGAAAVPALARLLKRREQHMRQRAAETLAEIADPTCFAPLMTALEDDDDRVRDAAARGLGAVGDPGAGPALIKVLLTSKDYDRVYSAEALGKLGLNEAVAPLITGLDRAVTQEDGSLLEKIVHALEAIGDVRAIEPLTRLLDWKDQGVRNAALTALEALGWRPASAEEEAHRTAARGDFSAPELSEAAALPSLLVTLTTAGRSADKRESLSVVVGVLQNRSGDISPEMLRRIAELPDQEGTYAIAYVPGFDGVEYEDYAREGDPDFERVDNLYYSTGKTGYEAIDCSAARNSANAELTHRVEEESDFAVLRKMLAQGVSEERVKAVEVLAASPSPDNVEAIVSLGLGRLDPLVSPAVDMALGVLGAEAVPLLLRQLTDPSPDRRNRVVRLLGCTAHKDAIIGLERALEDEEDQVRRAAVAATAEIADDRALDLLNTALADRRESISNLAHQLIASRRSRNDPRAAKWVGASESALRSAVEYGDLNKVRQLIDAGTEVNDHWGFENSALHIAAIGNRAEVARLLIGAGADLNARGKQGRTPLHYAAQQGNADVARVLLELGAEVSLRNEDDATPMMLAERQNRKSVALLLRRYGAR